ncbi:hypothetical protein [Maribellus maritimus]|uniref:hypothetical protein n=1 Tax=Maribellus maritimus TaxID=2870838 RepID=UPI001EE9CED4|nr:hypothetical protein [Maribellus maritimus]MCG6191491.1 hypothetical protein [Maribellus maritimus]
MTNQNTIKLINDQLSMIDEKGKKNRTGRFVMSALSSIPWVGGVIAASSALHGEKEQGKVNSLQKMWLEEHQKKIEELAMVIYEITEKLNSCGADIDERLESEDYQDLVKKGFKEWDNAETQEKKEYIQILLTNAAATSITTDDLIRLFIDWIRTYHETHFLVIKEIYKHKGITRGQIWKNLNPTIPREDSVEADLYKLLIRDLSMGGIIRQHRETDYSGNFVAKQTRRPKSGTLKSAFDNEEQYELTELGSQFVHYTMEDVVRRIGNE